MVQGREEGRKSTILEFYRKNLMMLEQAAKEYGVSEEEFRNLF